MTLSEEKLTGEHETKWRKMLCRSRARPGVITPLTGHRDGKEAGQHAVIDNFSRKILAWRVAERFEISNTIAVLQVAVRNAVSADTRPRLMADGGVENFNEQIDDLVDRGLLSRFRALVGVRFSNSMIESWWNNLEHQWLFLHQLETVAAVHRRVAFYVGEYNATIPHAAFAGQTADEI